MKAFEWVVTDAPHPAMVGRGKVDPGRFEHYRTTRAALMVAAALPHTFTVEDDTGAVIVRGKCAEPCVNQSFDALSAPARMTETVYSNASRVVYKLGEAQLGIYI